jgi:hypothetical protein
VRCPWLLHASRRQPFVGGNGQRCAPVPPGRPYQAAIDPGCALSRELLRRSQARRKVSQLTGGYPTGKAYYPGAHQLKIRITGDRTSGRLLGAQLVGHHDAEVAKRIDIPAGALFHHMTVDRLSDLDLSYTPPFGSPWDAIQLAAHDWVRAATAARP